MPASDDDAAAELRRLRAQVDELVAREAIRDVLHSYASAMDRADAEGVKRCYHPDATDAHFETFVGNAHEFADYMTGQIRRVGIVMHEISNPVIRFDGDRAFVESRYTSRKRVAAGGGEAGTWVESLAHGRYLDVFERRAGEWRIAHRRLVREGGRVALIKDIGRYPDDSSPHPWPDDLVYREFGILDLDLVPLRPPDDRNAELRAFGRDAQR